MLSGTTRRSTLSFSLAVVSLAVALSLFVSVQTGLAQSEKSGSSEAASRRREYDAIAKQAQALEQFTGLLKRVVKHAQPTVVHLVADKRSRLGQVTEAGAGVIIQHDGKYYVITNLHVVRNASLRNTTIHLADGRHTQPTGKWVDESTDIAVLGLNSSNLSHARIGDSDKLEIGDFVMAMGSPFGLSHSVTFGMLSAKGRYDLKLGTQQVKYQQFLQTDAAINPGNSGGPLVNLRGEVVGINTAIASNSGGNEGIGFAIPINIVIRIAKQLISGGKVTRGYLGVSNSVDSREIGPALAVALGLPSPHGVHVGEVTENSPAKRAKILAGDVIIEFDGDRVETFEHLVNLTGLAPVGKEVDVVVYRDGKPLSVRLTLSERPPASEINIRPAPSEFNN